MAPHEASLKDDWNRIQGAALNQKKNQILEKWFNKAERMFSLVLTRPIISVEFWMNSNSLGYRTCKASTLPQTITLFL
jgi:hypothetical protein